MMIALVLLLRDYTCITQTSVVFRSLSRLSLVSPEGTLILA